MTDTPAKFSPCVVRSEPPAKTDYHDYREELRYDFWYACAYCATAEVEATAFGFEIDHYLPQNPHPQLLNAYDNLMWCCWYCNNYKRKYEPTAADSAAGKRFFRPDWDDPDEHFEVQDDFSTRGLTTIGEYTEIILYLSRKQIKDVRKIRERLDASGAIILRGLQALRGLKLDRFPQEIRTQVLETRRRLTNDTQDSLLELDDILRQLNRSKLIDPDPDKKAAMRRRREYLKKNKAPIP